MHQKAGFLLEAGLEKCEAICELGDGKRKSRNEQKNPNRQVVQLAAFAKEN